MISKILIIEIFDHHECIENIYHFFKKKYKTQLVIGDYIDKKINLPGSLIYRLPQPWWGFPFEKNRWQKILYTILQIKYSIHHLIAIDRILKKEKPTHLHVNTIESEFSFLLMLYILKIKNIKLSITIHNIAIVKKNPYSLT